ncbi:unnamed protein product [Leptosia nina]|uniref:F-box domain-containing protein n=1 Tax=Leptosia nina TaxID=320188 RepID=A0AAV1JH13_9NEOP
MTSFADVSKQVHLIDDLILAEMICGKKDYCDESIEFSKHLLLTKFWFMRVSWKNKRKFLLLLLDDIRSVWTLSLLLKSIWNCRPKDAVSSFCEKPIWSSYDQVPMDNNRTALPESMVQEAITNDRNWFSKLEPDQQALVISELLTVSGGPIMWELLWMAKKIYNKHREQQLEEILECNVVNEAEKAKPVAVEQLDIALASWNTTVKTIRDALKLEEIEVTHKDESKTTIWKVNRYKPDNMETVDFLQLLPSVIAKRILLYVPQTQYGDLSRVNKYWAFLIDEIKLELLARQKINMDLEKLRDIIQRHNNDVGVAKSDSEAEWMSALTSYTKPTSVVTKSLPSFGWNRVKVRKPVSSTFKPLKKMSDLNKRLEQRGATDENIWKWCRNVLKLQKILNEGNSDDKQENEGILPLELNFPCPLMVQKFKIPLEYPLLMDPTLKINTKAVKNKRCNHWNKDLSHLYPVTKIPSYLSVFYEAK